jgi:hypothetical protein
MPQRQVVTNEKPSALSQILAEQEELQKKLLARAGDDEAPPQHKFGQPSESSQPRAREVSSTFPSSASRDPEGAPNITKTQKNNIMSYG